MSYCSPAWMSKYHYRKLLVGFQPYSQVSADQISLSRINIITQPILSVIGTVHTPTLTVDFGTFYPLNSVLPPDDSRGTDYCLELRDVSESLLDNRCFDLSFIAPESGEPMDRETFTLAIPYPDGAHSVVLTHQGTELGRASKSDNAPTVQLVYPNGGESWDATGTYTVKGARMTITDKGVVDVRGDIWNRARFITPQGAEMVSDVVGNRLVLHRGDMTPWTHAANFQIDSSGNIVASSIKGKLSATINGKVASDFKVDLSDTVSCPFGVCNNGVAIQEGDSYAAFKRNWLQEDFTVGSEDLPDLMEDKIIIARENPITLTKSIPTTQPATPVPPSVTTPIPPQPVTPAPSLGNGMKIAVNDKPVGNLVPNKGSSGFSGFSTKTLPTVLTIGAIAAAAGGIYAAVSGGGDDDDDKQSNQNTTVQDTGEEDCLDPNNCSVREAGL